ncbi:YihY/virulence factor BrkB family protein [Streptomyces sp. 3MP-14]|uniref:YihY/virulence factor BrkB family protein n=1 Tax=Streptomyces mimosae TaxID=2586635 RepID=A0A5N6A940_9ACTN|nr:MULTISPECIES: YihY/virulence factor BrkB family protein [Streptomyces]KAB8165327.1 YihY/virulence factor BrkB family protein [Streptomyces mimosae]KAB8175959.1 YihY/virulence factor BrkB family protein [Streptomyces sp. 3MP-14]
MERLRRLPWVGPAVDWFLRSRIWRIYQHLDGRHWSRLAAAITFTSFVALFPVLGLTAAVSGLLLDDRRLDDIESWLADQVPGISEQLDLGALFDHAGTIGLVSLLLVLPTGAAWIDALRGCLRAVWDLADPEDNVVLRRAKDVGVLAGLGAVTLVSLGVSALGQSLLHLAGRELDGLTWLVQLGAYAVAIGVTFLLLLYVLVWLPGVRPPRHATVAACLLGAVGMELLKLLLGGYLTEVAGRTVYGAFGVPVALLLWINMVAKLLLWCCAWTATAVSPRDRPDADALEATPAADDDGGTHTPPPPAPPDRRP